MKERTRASNDDGGVERRGRRRFNGQNSKTKTEQRNMQRLGGRGLSLEAFANAKSQDPNYYNPAMIKKIRESYKNAKVIKKYKKLKTQEEQQNKDSIARRIMEGINEGEGATTQVNQHNKKGQKSTAQILEETAMKKRKEREKAKLEKEASIQAKKDENQRAEARRKSLKGKMFKKTKSGQPVMKYRIEHILETLQGSSSQ